MAGFVIKADGRPCAHCRHIILKGAIATGGAYRFCLRTESWELSGNESLRDCDSTRADPTLCGPEGKWFEQFVSPPSLLAQVIHE